MASNQSFIFSIEGNIGSGKSTLVKELQDTFSEELKICNKKVMFIQEPVDIWNTIKDKDGVTILEKFYANQQEYAFSFQMMAYISRINLLRKAVKENPNTVIICERSVHTDREVFAKMLYDDDKIEEINYNIYLRWFDEFIDDIPIAGFIYLKTDAEICEQRIIKRSRQGETVPFEYLKTCENYHDSWLNTINSDAMMVISGNTSCDNDVTIVNKWCMEVIKYIENFVKSKAVRTVDVGKSIVLQES